MRYLDRQSVEPPDYLDSEEINAQRRLIDEYISMSEFESTQRRAPEYRDFLENYEIRNAVRSKSSYCCAYCERDAMDDGKIHHHRPAGLAADQKGETELLKYVWLIYEWENLYWVCQQCARRKGNRFFVRSSDITIGASLDELRKMEGALLLDPSFHLPHCPSSGILEPKAV